VNMHKHARLTPRGRELLIERLLGGEKAVSVGQSMGVSRRTVCKWLGRYRREGKAGLSDRSSRPRRSPRRTPQDLELRIQELRSARWTAPRIAREVQRPISTVGRVLRRVGLAKLPPLNPPPPVIRYERSRPGEMIHVDTKKLARIAQVGHRIHGDQSKRVRRVGWEYLYVAVDDATRLAYTAILPNEKGETAALFLEQVGAWFQSRCVRIERVMTDNGSCFRSRAFQRVREDVGARHVRTRPYTPRTNGKAERFIQSAMREWGYAAPYPSSIHRESALPHWTSMYNEARPHMGIRGRTPEERFLELRL
jgi:transposase InsO family protein